MKLIKFLTIIIIVSSAVSILYSQDTAGDSGSSVVTDNQINNGNGDAGNTPVKDVKEPGAVTDSVNSGNKQTSEVIPRRENSVKTAKKKTGTVVVQEEAVKTADDSESGDYLLSINEGNFKYKRIPDIKLVEKSPSMAEQNTLMTNASGDAGTPDNSAETGFFGLSKNAADVVAKGGILLLVLGIFILYKFRSRGTGRRSSSSSVMNSYRK